MTLETLKDVRLEDVGATFEQLKRNGESESGESGS